MCEPSAQRTDKTGSAEAEEARQLAKAKRMANGIAKMEAEAKAKKEERIKKMLEAEASALQKEEQALEAEKEAAEEKRIKETRRREAEKANAEEAASKAKRKADAEAKVAAREAAMEEARRDAKLRVIQKEREKEKQEEEALRQTEGETVVANWKAEDAKEAEILKVGREPEEREMEGDCDSVEDACAVANLEAEADALFDAIDTNGNGVIEKSEFIQSPALKMANNPTKSVEWMERTLEAISARKAEVTLKESENTLETARSVTEALAIADAAAAEIESAERAALMKDYEETQAIRKIEERALTEIRKVQEEAEAAVAEAKAAASRAMKEAERDAAIKVKQAEQAAKKKAQAGIAKSGEALMQLRNLLCDGSTRVEETSLEDPSLFGAGRRHQCLSCSISGARCLSCSISGMQCLSEQEEAALVQGELQGAQQRKRQAAEEVELLRSQLALAKQLPTEAGNSQPGRQVQVHTVSRVSVSKFDAETQWEEEEHETTKKMYASMATVMCAALGAVLSLSTLRLYAKVAIARWVSSCVCAASSKLVGQLSIVMHDSAQLEAQTNGNIVAIEQRTEERLLAAAQAVSAARDGCAAAEERARHAEAAVLQERKEALARLLEERAEREREKAWHDETQVDAELSEALKGMPELLRLSEALHKERADLLREKRESSKAYAALERSQEALKMAEAGLEDERSRRTVAETALQEAKATTEITVQQAKKETEITLQEAEAAAEKKLREAEEAKQAAIKKCEEEEHARKEAERSLTEEQAARKALLADVEEEVSRLQAQWGEEAKAAETHASGQSARIEALEAEVASLRFALRGKGMAAPHPVMPPEQPCHHPASVAEHHSMMPSPPARTNGPYAAIVNAATVASHNHMKIVTDGSPVAIEHSARLTESPLPAMPPGMIATYPMLHTMESIAPPPPRMTSVALAPTVVSPAMDPVSTMPMVTPRSPSPSPPLSHLEPARATSPHSSTLLPLGSISAKLAQLAPGLAHGSMWSPTKKPRESEAVRSLETPLSHPPANHDEHDRSLQQEETPPSHGEKETSRVDTDSENQVAEPFGKQKSPALRCEAALPFDAPADESSTEVPVVVPKATDLKPSMAHSTPLDTQPSQVESCSPAAGLSQSNLDPGLAMDQAALQALSHKMEAHRIAMKGAESRLARTQANMAARDDAALLRSPLPPALCLTRAPPQPPLSPPPPPPPAGGIRLTAAQSRTETLRAELFARRSAIEQGPHVMHTQGYVPWTQHDPASAVQAAYERLGVPAGLRM